MSPRQATPPMSAATFCASSRFTSSTATLAPRRASSRAVASPRPEAPPVTSAACPSIFMRGLLGGGSGCRLQRERQGVVVEGLHQPVAVLEHGALVDRALVRSEERRVGK